MGICAFLAAKCGEIPIPSTRKIIISPIFMAVFRAQLKFSSAPKNVVHSPFGATAQIRIQGLAVPVGTTHVGPKVASDPAPLAVSCTSLAIEVGFGDLMAGQSPEVHGWRFSVRNIIYFYLFLWSMFQPCLIA